MRIGLRCCTSRSPGALRAITEALVPAVDAQPYGCKATVLRRWARVASINTYSFVL
jgi:hypothetical protein